MGRADVGAALARMDDDEVRERIEAGDLSDLDDLSLDDAERTMVQDAAAAYPEVVGFAFSSFGLGLSSDKWYKLDTSTLGSKLGGRPNAVIEGVFKYAMGDGSV